MTVELEQSVETQADPYQVHLAQFDGPLDLLLHLIKKNEINIYDIPIAVITKQYLEQISLMKSLNLEVAGEFLVMAATLMYIKSRLLLPVEPAEEEESGPDPRADLVRQLLEYKQFKEAAHDLGDRERQWREVYVRGPGPSSAPLPPREDTGEEDGSLELTLFDLVDALQGVIQRTPAKTVLEVSAETLTVRDRMTVILERLEEAPALSFETLFGPDQGRMVLIVTFLGLLELIRLRLVRAFQAEAFGPILVSRAFLPVLPDAQPGENE